MKIFGINKIEDIYLRLRQRNSEINYKDGRKYEGEAIIPNTCIEEYYCVSDLIPHGKGKLTYQYGIYEGEYRNGLREGQGIINYKNQSKYVGVFKNNQKQ